jgi:flagellar basal body-associated protein FliL
MTNSNSQNNKLILVLVLVLISIVVAGFVFLNKKDEHFYLLPHPNETDTITQPETITETMELIVYLQNQEEIISNDCGITYPQTIQVPKTSAVADADYHCK